MRTKTINLGDIFELETPNDNKIHLQCVHIPKDLRNEVELIKVFFNLHKKTPNDLSTIIKEDYFFIRFPLKAALKKGIVNQIGNYPLPDGFTIPLFYRTINFSGTAWQIVNSKTLKRETVDVLSEEQKELSPFGGMNDTMIIELLEKGWNLKNWTLNNMFSE